VVLGFFRTRLSHALTTTSRILHVAEADQRLGPILALVRARWATAQSSRPNWSAESEVGDAISLKDLPSSIETMPLCARNMMNLLQENHHLRHSARLHLGLFLKGCGLTCDESIMFWKQEFMKSGMTSEKWNKDYKYNIEHMYGKVGKKVAMNPYPCSKIIMSRPGVQDQHGCPYREMEIEKLRKTLEKISIPRTDIPSIVNQAKDGHWQAACGMCFTSRFVDQGLSAVEKGNATAFVPEHPNEYFIEARRIMNQMTVTPSARR